MNDEVMFMEAEIIVEGESRPWSYVSATGPCFARLAPQVEEDLDEAEEGASQSRIFVTWLRGGPGD